jgi:hypothetical protein
MIGDEISGRDVPWATFASGQKCLQGKLVIASQLRFDSADQERLRRERCFRRCRQQAPHQRPVDRLRGRRLRSDLG